MLMIATAMWMCLGFCDCIAVNAMGNAKVFLH